MAGLQEMKILVVDDSRMSRTLIKTLLNKLGFHNVDVADSAGGAFDYLSVGSGKKSDVDLILMDIVMKDMSGIETTRRIKDCIELAEIPIVMVTGNDNKKIFEEAFDAGAVDYISKPVDRVELKVRVTSLLTLKQETDRRKEREDTLTHLAQQLEAANAELKRISSLDGLTGIANRRHFDETLAKEWRRALRGGKTIALGMIDVDYFKLFNDSYGHQAGDRCLQMVAKLLDSSVSRPGDMSARYGGEEFVIIMPSTSLEEAKTILGKVRAGIENKSVPHKASSVTGVVTISIGVASVFPSDGIDPAGIIKLADEALYKAKENGRNRVETA